MKSMSNKILKQVEVTTTQGIDTYYGKDALSVEEALDYAGRTGATWTAPFETFTGESIEYNFNQIVKIQKEYQFEQPDPKKAIPKHEEATMIEGADEWDQITSSAQEL